jgi:hypothetical protein
MSDICPLSNQKRTLGSAQRPGDLSSRTATTGRVTAPARRQDIGSRPRRDGDRSRTLIRGRIRKRLRLPKRCRPRMLNA